MLLMLHSHSHSDRCHKNKSSVTVIFQRWNPVQWRQLWFNKMNKKISMFLYYYICLLYLSHTGFTSTAKLVEGVMWTQKIDYDLMAGMSGHKSDHHMWFGYWNCFVSLYSPGLTSMNDNVNYLRKLLDKWLTTFTKSAVLLWSDYKDSYKWHTQE